MRQEVITRNNPNITEHTHPTLYNLVKELAEKAQIAMPRYISLYDGEYTWVDENGNTHKGMHDIGASVDVLGDMYLCKKIILNLPYKTVEGIVACAIAEKALNVRVKTAGVGFGIWGAALSYAIANDVKLGSVPFETRVGGRYVSVAHRSTMEVAFPLSIMFAILAAKVYSNNVQKDVDLKAMKLTDAQNVVDGIKGASQATEAYVKENIFSRLTPEILKQAWRIVFYPIRAYTPEERIAYVEQAAACQGQVIK